MVPWLRITVLNGLKEWDKYWAVEPYQNGSNSAQGQSSRTLGAYRALMVKTWVPLVFLPPKRLCGSFMDLTFGIWCLNSSCIPLKTPKYFGAPGPQHPSKAAKIVKLLWLHFSACLPSSAVLSSLSHPWQSGMLIPQIFFLCSQIL